VNADNSHRCFFVTDDRHPSDIVAEGHMDHAVRSAIRAGVPPVTAIQMATLNPARYFMLNEHGVVAPGCFADLIAFESLEELRIKKVFKNGALVSDEGKPLWDPPERPRMSLRGSVNIKWLEDGAFEVPARGRRVRVIDLLSDQLVTGAAIEEPRIVDGRALSDPERDILKLVVVERHQASGKMGFGFVRGVGLKTGAIASTIAHDAHNIIVVGASDEDIMAAVIHLNKIGGGLAIARDGEAVADLALPVAGLMSRQPLENVYQRLDDLVRRAGELGVRLRDPFMTLSFLALPVIPALKLTDQGLVDVARFEHVDLFVD
jgi:adenine deaminase